MGESVSEIGEFGLIHRIEQVIREKGTLLPEVRIGLGDDAASLLPRAGYELIITCDVLVEGRHYLPEWIPPFDLGKRAMVVNTSDIGAMGGIPRYALISLGLRSDTLVSEVEALYHGLLSELANYGAAVIGGNISKAEEAAFISITVIGEAKIGRTLCRSTARTGDAILVTGHPGQAAAGLRLLLSHPGEPLHGDPLVRAYHAPEARVKEGRAIADTGTAHAMIDTSDGFLGDLGHICETSRVGAMIVKEKLPLSPELVQAASRLGVDPYDLFLGDSDDYELIITCPPHGVDRIRDAVASVGNVPVTEVGRITEPEKGIRLLLPDGTEQGISKGGWDHFA